MTQQETNKILAIILEIYPSFGKDRNPELTSRLWGKLFEDEPYQVVENAVMAFFATDTKGFPPTPGNIKDKVNQLTNTGEMSEMEAWNLVVRAASNGYYGAKTEFDKLPPEIQEIVGSPSMLREWSMMDADEFMTVIGSNFQRSYRAKAEYRRVNNLLPGSMKINLQKKEVQALPSDEKPDGLQSIGDVARKMFSLTAGR